MPQGGGWPLRWAVGGDVATEMLAGTRAYPRFAAPLHDGIGTGLELRYPVLANLCTAANTAASTTHVSLPRGALLAIFDHALMYSMAVADKWGRPVCIKSTKTC